MGVDGPGVFDDDVACDVRDEYEELLRDQVGDREAAQRVLDLFLPDPDADERHLLWLALAAAQSRLGRLEPQIRDQALAQRSSRRDMGGARTTFVSGRRPSGGAESA